MNSNMKPIQETVFNDYFENVDTNIIFGLSSDYSSKRWEQDIDKIAPSYYRLKNDSWLASKEFIVIGRWIEAYNSDDNSAVVKQLTKHLNWDANDTVRYYIAKPTVLETKWKYFLKHWDDFLAVEDDCPILIKDGEGRQCALVFTPLGEIRLVNSRCL